MTVARGVQLAAGAGAFRWNLEKGTATLRPPAPFTGSATFTRHGHDGHGAWKGSLAHADLRWGASGAGRRRVPCLHPQRRAAGRVRHAQEAAVGTRQETPVPTNAQ